MPYVVKVGKDGFLRRGRVDQTPTTFHHPSSCQRAIDAFEARYPERKGQCVLYVWRRGLLSNV